MPQSIYIYIYAVIIRPHKDGSAWKTKYYNEGRYIQMNTFRQFYVSEIDLQECEFAFKQSCTMAQRTEGTLFCNKQNGHLASCFCHPCAIVRFCYDVWIISILKIMFG